MNAIVERLSHAGLPMNFVKQQFTVLILFFIPSIFPLSGYAQNQLFPDTIRSCKVDSLILDAGYGFDSYLWNTGDTTQSIWIYGSGNFWINVTQGDTVNITDSIFVNIVLAKILQNDTVIKCGDTLLLSGTSSLFNYTWFPQNDTADSIFVYPRDTLYYYAQINDPDIAANYCLDSIKIEVKPTLVVDTLIQLQTGCPGINDGQVRVDVSGGYPPYQYDWSAGQPSPQYPFVDYNLTDGEKNVIVTDSIGCFIKHFFNVKAYPLPEIDLNAEPDKEVFIQKPYVYFSFENPLFDSLGVDTFQLSSWEWKFGDSITSPNTYTPEHAYTNVGTYKVEFNFNTYYNCQGTDTITIVVKPVKLNFPAVFTPNGDEWNQHFEIFEDTGGGSGTGTGGQKYSMASDTAAPIDLSKYYLSNTLVVFNRWGKKVFEVDNYQNDWDGDGLNDGIYFFLLSCKGAYQDKVYKGSVMIIREP